MVGAVSVPEPSVRTVGGVTVTRAAMVDGYNCYNVAKATCSCSCNLFVNSHAAVTPDAVTVVYYSQNFRIEPRFITIIFIVRL